MASLWSSVLSARNRRCPVESHWLVVTVPFVATVFAIVRLWQREVVPIDIA